MEPNPRPVSRRTLAVLSVLSLFAFAGLLFVLALAFGIVRIQLFPLPIM